ncbi:hypothetical protein JTB14_019252 [Gonioctena quinquepunctata]|nr:hypothetical protein JTB14_019252 [Gonioctena quinquepunctata]
MDYHMGRNCRRPLIQQMTQRSVSTDLTCHADYGQSSTELEQVAENVLIPYTNGAGQNPHNVIEDLRGKLSATSYQNVLTVPTIMTLKIL